MESIEKAYSPKETSITLDIGDSTLRKWCIALEKSGYKFIRGDNNNGRVFVEGDLVVLRHFQNLLKVHHMPIENAANLIVDRFGERASESSTGGVPANNERDLFRSDNEVVTKLLARIERQGEQLEAQEQFNKKLLERLDQQQQYIEERLNHRDEMLLQSLREAQETKQLLLATKDEQQKKPRKGFLRFFSKE